MVKNSSSKSKHSKEPSTSLEKKYFMKALIALTVTVFVVLVLIVGTMAVKQPQDIRKDASLTPGSL